MKILECPLLKNRVALGCIGLLGLSTCSGLIHTSVSSGFSKTLSSLFSRLGGASGAGVASQESGAGEKISPVQWVANTGDKVWKDYLTPFVNTTYTWITTKDKRGAVWRVLKQFWNYKFFKGVATNLPRIIFSWVYIISNREKRYKLFLAWKYTLKFFDSLVSKNSTHEKIIPHFGYSFAELLFFPYFAIIKNFYKDQRRNGESQCPAPELARGDAANQERETICMSVTWENKAEKK